MGVVASTRVTLQILYLISSCHRMLENSTSSLSKNTYLDSHIFSLQSSRLYLFVTGNCPMCLPGSVSPIPMTYCLPLQAYSFLPNSIIPLLEKLSFSSHQIPLTLRPILPANSVHCFSVLSNAPTFIMCQSNFASL
jgi:hypothetical protein